MESTLNIQKKISRAHTLRKSNSFLTYAEAYKENEALEIVKNELFFDDLQVLYINNLSKNSYKLTVPEIGKGISFYYQFTGTAEVMSYFGKLIFTTYEQNIFLSENRPVFLTLESASECCLVLTTNEKIIQYFSEMKTLWTSLFSKKGKSVFPGCQWPITFSMHSCIEEMLNSGRKGFLLKLHLESSILKLILLHFEQIENYDCPILCSIKKMEYNRMYKVRKLILDNLNQWFTISVLACRTGTNECSLKKGFKEVFGLSVFEFVKKTKMEKAYCLLCDTEITISHISEDLGYKNHTHFSAAFKKNFGISPKEVRQLHCIHKI